MLLNASTKTYIDSFIIPAFSLIVSAGLMCRMYIKLINLQQEEEIAGTKILKIIKKYVGLMILVNILATIIYLIDGYFR